MNNDISHKIKSSLENFEAPYDASAWDQLSQRLDAKSTSGNSFTSYPKTWIVISITIIGASLGIYKFSTPVEQPILVNRVQLKNTTEFNSEKVVLTDTSPAQESNGNKPLREVKTASKEHTTSNSQNQLIQQNSAQSVHSDVSVQKNTPVLKSNERPLKSYIYPKTTKVYCVGEKIEVFNANTSDMYLTHSSGKQLKIDAQESLLISLKQEGSYSWNSGEKFAFEVKEKPAVNFTFPSDIIYENGIPTITITSDLNAKNQKWYYDQKVVSTNDFLKLNIFTKEKYAVTLQITGVNGCENQLTKTFYPDPSFQYNLKAPTGFDPTSSNSKRNTFLPLSLYERDTPFRMLIIDPKDGNVIFESTDKNNPWDGRNQKTDQLVAEDSEYIWKVILMNPEKNEKNEYKGMITRK